MRYPWNDEISLEGAPVVHTNTSTVWHVVLDRVWSDTRCPVQDTDLLPCRKGRTFPWYPVPIGTTRRGSLTRKEDWGNEDKYHGRGKYLGSNYDVSVRDKSKVRQQPKVVETRRESKVGEEGWWWRWMTPVRETGDQTCDWILDHEVWRLRRRGPTRSKVWDGGLIEKGFSRSVKWVWEGHQRKKKEHRWIIYLLLYLMDLD